VLIDGREIADQIEYRVIKEIKTLSAKPHLAVVLVGDDSASRIYVHRKEEAARRVGIDFFLHELSANTSQEEVMKLVRALNADPQVNGIIVQLPLPEGFDEAVVLDCVSLNKDVDGISSRNLACLPFGTSIFVPATAAAVLEVLRSQKIKIIGSHAVVVGGGRVAGLPVALSLLGEGATITICADKTKNLGELTRGADILVSAVGRASLIKLAMVKRGVAVLDVGITRKENKLCGDVDPVVERAARFITPVPGGIGPVTVAKLLENTLKAWRLQNIH